MSLSASAFRRITKEITQLISSPPDSIRIVVAEDDLLDVVGWIEGPVGTPYEGGYFAVKFNFTHEFPAAPPKCWFQTKIFHPNVNESTGEICVSTLKKDWQREFGIGHILQTVKCLLIAPNPESTLNEEAGKMLLEQYDDYTRHAQLITSIHARSKPANLPTPFTAASSVTAPSAKTGKVATTTMRPLLPSENRSNRSCSPSCASTTSRGDSPEVVLHPLPLQASASTNSLADDAMPGVITSAVPSPSKKRPAASTLTKATAPAPEAKKTTSASTSAAGGAAKKRGLRRL